jgi:hypothetical protein
VVLRNFSVEGDVANKYILKKKPTGTGRGSGNTGRGSGSGRRDDTGLERPD